MRPNIPHWTFLCTAWSENPNHFRFYSLLSHFFHLPPKLLTFLLCSVGKATLLACRVAMNIRGNKRCEAFYKLLAHNSASINVHYCVHQSNKIFKTSLKSDFIIQPGLFVEPWCIPCAVSSLKLLQWWNSINARRKGAPPYIYVDLDFAQQIPLLSAVHVTYTDHKESVKVFLEVEMPFRVWPHYWSMDTRKAQRG